MRKTAQLTCLALALAVTGAACGGGDDDGEAPDAATASAVPFDRAFIDGMVPHHESAIEMADAARQAGLAEPDLLAIAADIVRTQQAEIDRMKAWRDEWFGSAEIDPRGAESLGLSEEQMGMQHAAGDLATADDVDAAFAAMMIDHHEGAIRMAELALEQGEHAELRELAEEIIAAQEREIEVMREHAAGVHHG
jgi:uncharacterized protein (DUF305 family)